MSPTPNHDARAGRSEFPRRTVRRREGWPKNKEDRNCDAWIPLFCWTAAQMTPRLTIQQGKRLVDEISVGSKGGSGEGGRSTCGCAGGGRRMRRRGRF